MHDTLEVLPGHLLIKSQSAAFYSSRKHGQRLRFLNLVQLQLKALP